MDEEETRKDKLDIFYCQVKKYILQYQSGSIGLFPLHTSGKNEDSHVRDNVYCAMAVWALGLAYRHMDDSDGRAYELQQAAVKCMRGILFCYMRQADKVEQFKKNQSSHNSLHVKFNVNTGDTVTSDYDWEHLQIDAVSLYLLTLVQMTASGLQIIYTNDEVDFVQTWCITLSVLTELQTTECGRGEVKKMWATKNLMLALLEWQRQPLRHSMDLMSMASRGPPPRSFMSIQMPITETTPLCIQCCRLHHPQRKPMPRY